MHDMVTKREKDHQRFIDEYVELIKSVVPYEDLEIEFQEPFDIVIKYKTADQLVELEKIFNQMSEDIEVYRKKITGE